MKQRTGEEWGYEERDLSEPLPYGTPVIVTRGVYRGLPATTGDESWWSYLLTIKVGESRSEVAWVPRGDFEIDYAKLPPRTWRKRSGEGRGSRGQERDLPEPLPHGTPVIVMCGVYRGLPATTGDESWGSYLLTIKVSESQSEVVWVPRGDFEIDYARLRR